MAIPASFDSATGALTGDNLDNTIATGHGAARPTPSLRDDPDAGGQIQGAVHQPIPTLRGDPDDGGQIQNAMQRPAPSLRSDPDAGGQNPERRAPADPQPQERPRRRRPDPKRRTPADPQPLGRPRRRRPESKVSCSSLRVASTSPLRPTWPARAISSCSAQPPGWCRPRRHFPPRAPLTPRLRSRSGPRLHSRRF